MSTELALQIQIESLVVHADRSHPNGFKHLAFALVQVNHAGWFLAREPRQGRDGLMRYLYGILRRLCIESDSLRRVSSSNKTFSLGLSSGRHVILESKLLKRQETSLDEGLEWQRLVSLLHLIHDELRGFDCRIEDTLKGFVSISLESDSVVVLSQALHLLGTRLLD